jgi:hypothetical protein
MTDEKRRAQILAAITRASEEMDHRSLRHLGRDDSPAVSVSSPPLLTG